MKAVVLMFDSLNRHFLSAYGCDWTHTPNFQRLAKRAATFDTSYVCSMPCMPARRDFHTARPNFLHNSWSPLEPFDDSCITLLNQAGVQTHLATDHYHYFEDGGLYYNTRYKTWEFFRGQEGDPFKGQVAPPVVPDNINGKGRPQDWINRPFMREEQNQPGPHTIKAGIDYLERNANDDRWCLTMELFDPHEPFFTCRKYRDLYRNDYEGPLFDWPPYAPVDHTPEQVEEIRFNYAALLSQCDAHLGDILDTFDRLELWDDTMLIIWTDHGHMLGEHGLFAKNYQPWYEELSHTPFFIWDPRNPGAAGKRRESLVQPALDVGPTLLEYFGVERTPDMLGCDLSKTIADDTPVREAGLFGVFSGHVNVTDGRHVYMRAAENADVPVERYTMQHQNLRGQTADKVQPQTGREFSFTKGYTTWKYTGENPGPSTKYGTLLFNVEDDPGQAKPLRDIDVEAKMTAHLVRLMGECDAPDRLYDRLGVSKPS